MRRALITMVAVATLLAPASCLVGVAVVMNPAAQADCRAATDLTVGEIPHHLDATTGDGTPVRLNKTQLTRAATIITTGSRTRGIGRDGVIVALMAALTESRLRMLANTSAYPESGNYPNDGDGSDHDSLGMFQMRPSTGWGTVEQLMDPVYQSKAFYGGPTGPNHGMPRGLLDIPGWRDMPKGAAAQAVEVSAHPDRYATWEPVADTILAALTRPGADPPPLPNAGRLVFPLPEGTWVRTSGYGWRTHPITGIRTLHTGVDYAAPPGTPIMAVAAGRVATAGPAAGYGNLIVIEHRINGQLVASAYAHMPHGGVHVEPGEHVTAGRHIGDVGATGNSTGPHLHIEMRPGGAGANPIDPERWLDTERAAILDEPPATPTGGCA